MANAALLVLLVVSLVAAGCSSPSAVPGSQSSAPGAGSSSAVSSSSMAPGPTANPPQVRLFQEVYACHDTFTGKDTMDNRPLLAFGGSPSPNYKWTLASGSAFPAGTTVAPETGIANLQGGTLAPAGTYNVQMQVSDGSVSAQGSIRFTIESASSAPQGGVPGVGCPKDIFGVIGGNLADAQAGHAYGASINAVGGVGNGWSWTASGGLAASGLALDEHYGVVHGVPMASAAGTTVTFTVAVLDQEGNVADCSPSCTFNIGVH